MTRQEQYTTLLAQLDALYEAESDKTALMANTAAALHDTFGDRFFWTGFYRVVTPAGGQASELVLGPFQGPVACMHIAYGRGVCGTAWQTGITQRVPDVELFPGHIACSSLSRSEIVVPVKGADGTVRAVLDIDSRDLDAFDADDQEGLERIAALLARTLHY